MDKKFFKAHLYDLFPNKEKNYSLNHKDVEKYMDYNKKIILMRYLYKMADYINETKNYLVEDNEIINILNDYFETKIDSEENEMKIIFEIVQDENGYLYAKEIYTGYLFPIVKMDDFKFNYSAKAIVREADERKAAKYKLSVHLEFEYQNPNLGNLNVGVWYNNYSIVSQTDINIYLNEFKKMNIFGKEKTNLYKINQLKELNESNKIKIDIKEKENVIVEREKNDDISIIMENIDFLLHKLDTINHELATKKKEEYDRYLNSEENFMTLSPLTIENLINFESELELMIQFPNRKNEDIISFLENILEEYNTNEKTVRNIDDIDKLCKLFFQTKNNLSFTIRRKATENIALIYIYEIYENRENIRLEDLSNSYFNDLLKTILICIDDMIKNGIIENDILINYNSEITPEYILDLIKQIKFISKEKDKQKRLEYRENNPK